MRGRELTFERVRSFEGEKIDRPDVVKWALPFIDKSDRSEKNGWDRNFPIQGCNRVEGPCKN